MKMNLLDFYKKNVQLQIKHFFQKIISNIKTEYFLVSIPNEHRFPIIFFSFISSVKYRQKTPLDPMEAI